MKKVLMFIALFTLAFACKAEEPTIQQVGACTAVATKTVPDKPAQVTTTCPGGQVTIQFPDGTVKIIQASGQIIEVKPE